MSNELLSNPGFRVAGKPCPFREERGRQAGLFYHGSIVCWRGNLHPFFSWEAWGNGSCDFFLFSRTLFPAAKAA